MAAVIADVGGLTVVAFPPSWLRVFLPNRPMTAREFLESHDYVTACMDGAMFGFCADQPHDYRTFECGAVDYGIFDGVTGALRLPRYPARGGTMVVIGGRARATRGCDVADWASADVAWQGYPELVRDGEVVHRAEADANVTKRAGGGLLADGRVFLAAATASMHEFALAGRRAGATALFYGDGGGSGVVAARVAGGVLADAPGALDSRRVPSFVAAVNPLHWTPYGRLPGRRP